MSKEKISLIVLGLLPLILAIGAFWYAAILLLQTFHPVDNVNVGLQGMVYMGVGIVSLIGVAMLYSSYKILAFASNRQ